MLNAYETLLTTGAHNDMTIDELLGHLIDAEEEERYGKKVMRLIRNANFRINANISDIDKSPDRKLDKTLLSRLLEMNWVTEGENVILTGKTGAGKTYMSCAIGHYACTKEYKTVYFPVVKLFRQLRESQADNSFSRLLKKVSTCDILILDDFGLEPFTAENRRWFLEILEERYGRHSTIISTQLPEKVWGKVIGDATFADAIIDRLIHTRYKFNVEGDTLRKRRFRSKKAT
jgi:DNA replication protein DnaC